MSKEQQILMLGILSLLCCSLLGPLAWLQANEALGMIGASLLVLQVFVLFMWFASGGTHRSYQGR